MSPSCRYCPACGVALTVMRATPDKQVCPGCGAVYTAQATSVPESDPFGGLTSAREARLYRQRARGQRPRLVKIVFTLIAVQLVIVASLALGMWLWLRPKPGSTRVADTATLAHRLKSVAHSGPAKRPSSKNEPKDQPASDAGPSEAITVAPEAPITPLPPRPDDPAVPGLVAKLKSAKDEARLAIITDLSDRGSSARKALPALIDLLKQNTGPVQVQAGADPAPAIERRTNLVTGLLKAIQQIGVDPALIGPLLVDLKSKDESIATAAAYVLALAGEAALDKVLPLLRAKDPVLRYRAVRVLFYSPSLPDRALQPVIDRLSDDNDAVRQAAPGVLIHLGPKAAAAVPALIKAVQAKRVLAAMALGSIGPAAKDAVPVLRQALKDKDTATDLIPYTDPVLTRLGITKPSLAGTAALALEEIGGAAESAIPDLITTLHHKQADARLQAARALGRLAGDVPTASAALAKVMSDDKEQLVIRAEAVEALGQLGKPAIQSLIGGLKMKSATLRTAAARNLGRNAPLPPEAITALADALNDAEPTVRVAAVRVLGQAGEEGLRVIDHLEKALLFGGQDPAVVEAIAQALSGLGDAGSAVLVKALKAGTPAVRSACARALGMSASPPAAATLALLDTMRDSDESVRTAAAEALGRLGQEAKSALSVLKQHAATDPSVKVRQAAADALSRIGEP